MDNLSLLKSCPLFFELYDKEILKLVKYCSVYTFADGEHIVTDGTEGDQIFVLLQGEARVEKDTGEERLFIQPLESGDVFGEMALMGEKQRTADVVSSGHSSVLEIRYDQIFKLFAKEPRIFGLLLFNISRLVSRRLAHSNAIIVRLQKEATQKDVA